MRYYKPHAKAQIAGDEAYADTFEAAFRSGSASDEILAEDQADAAFDKAYSKIFDDNIADDCYTAVFTEIVETGRKVGCTESFIKVIAEAAGNTAADYFIDHYPGIPLEPLPMTLAQARHILTLPEELSDPKQETEAHLTLARAPAVVPRRFAEHAKHYIHAHAAALDTFAEADPNEDGIWIVLQERAARYLTKFIQDEETILDLSDYIADSIMGWWREAK